MLFRHDRTLINAGGVKMLNKLLRAAIITALLCFLVRDGSFAANQASLVTGQQNRPKVDLSIHLP